MIEKAQIQVTINFHFTLRIVKIAWGFGVLGLSAIAASGAYSDLSGAPTAATTSAAGLMPAADKSKVDGLTLTSSILHIPDQPAFSAIKSSDVNSITDTDTVILFDNVSVNVGNNYSSTTGRFTAPIDGTYSFTFFGLSRKVGMVRGEIQVNGNEKNIYYLDGVFGSQPSQQGNDNLRQITLTTILSLDEDDYVTLVITNGTLFANHNSFSGHLIGQS